MHNAVAKPQVVQHVRDMLILRARKYIHMDAHAAQLACQVAHIYVHPAGVFTAQGCQRTGMVG